MKNVVIVGVGALGSHVVQFLRSADCTIKVIDFDRVEQKNTLSQFHGKPSVGKSKVQALQQTMNLLWGMKIDGVPHKLTAENDTQLLGKSDLIIDCLDNGVARRIVQAFVRKTKTACLHGALAANGEFGRVIWDGDFTIDDEDGSGAATCEDGEFLPFITLVSAYLAQAASVYIKGGKKVGFSIHAKGAVSI